MTGFDDGVNFFKNPEAGLLSEILIAALSLSSEDFWNLLKLGAIYVNDERQTKNKFIAPNNSFRVHSRPRRFKCDFPWHSLIVFENDFCLVLNKPSGIPSHPGLDNAVENALTQTSLARRYPLFVTHRLDTLTSGLIVYAKKASFAKSFNRQLQERSIEKKYVALVEGTKVLPQKLTHFMNPAAGTPKKLADAPSSGWALCELEILAQKEVAPGLCWVKLKLLTGKTHQIRAQLSYVGAPILGDKLYGARQAFGDFAIALRSCEIEFNCGDERLKISLKEEFEF